MTEISDKSQLLLGALLGILGSYLGNWAVSSYYYNDKAISGIANFGFFAVVSALWYLALIKPSKRNN